jgi:hypothetical protein
MPATTDHAVAVRATAFIETRWLRRPVRRIRYDACWADGLVAFDLSLTAAMYGGWPADFEPISDSVHANCPEVGTGPRVNEFAAIVDGPAAQNPNPPGPHSAWPRPFGVSRRESSPRARLAWRLSLGVVALGLGIRLVTGPSSDGILGWVWVFCSLGGLATLAGALPRWLRWW